LAYCGQVGWFAHCGGACDGGVGHGVEEGFRPHPVFSDIEVEFGQCVELRFQCCQVASFVRGLFPFDGEITLCDQYPGRFQPVAALWSAHLLSGEESARRRESCAGAVLLFGNSALRFCKSAPG
jgi:hypothetical protein